MVLLFFKRRDYTASAAGGALGFVGSDCVASGYGIEFDIWQNRGDTCGIQDPPSNHIALIKDSPATHLALVYVDESRTEDNQWHSVKVSVIRAYGGAMDYVEVLLDERPVLDWTGHLDRQFSGFGFAASTGAHSNWHIIDDVKISRVIYLQASSSLW